jgi:hypothetical protein
VARGGVPPSPLLFFLNLCFLAITREGWLQNIDSRDLVRKIFQIKNLQANERYSKRMGLPGTFGTRLRISHFSVDISILPNRP